MKPSGPGSKPTTGILGGGVSGVCLAAHLDAPFRLFEKAPRLGGLCASVIERGFTFDAAGPHILFSKNKDVLQQMVAVLGDNVQQRRRENKIWFKGHFVKYPFENGLSDLPKEDCFECILGYLKNPWTKPPENLEEWSYATFGAGISDKYFLPYNRKIWNVEPSSITLDWVSRIPKPPLEDVLKSAIGISTEGYLHQLYFYYPKRGGYESIVHAYATQATGGELLTECPVTRIEGGPGAWLVEVGGDAHRFDTLISTLPIHELARVWPGFPAQARSALSKLRYNSLICVLVGLNEDRGYPYTALYVPDPQIPFHRLSFPKNFSPECAPAGASAMMAEITCAYDDEVWSRTDDDLVGDTIAKLVDMGLASAESVSYTRVMRFRYGYPIYDHAYFQQTRQLREAVAQTGLELLGRFAEFEYINSDQCVERALSLANKLNGAKKASE